jgi:hypothetical protein
VERNAVESGNFLTGTMLFAMVDFLSARERFAHFRLDSMQFADPSQWMVVVALFRLLRLRASTGVECLENDEQAL